MVTTGVSRRGFRKAPAAVRQEAERIVGCYSPPLLAELRPATHCGPNGPGANGDFILAITSQHGIALRTIGGRP